MAATAGNPESNPSTAGVAVYAPNMPGGSGMYGCCSSTIQAFHYFSIPPSSHVSFTVYLVTGTVTEIRDTIYQLAGLPTGPRHFSQTLNINQEWTSGDGRFNLYYQADENLVLYKWDWSAIWASWTNDNNPGRVVMQEDGNLVIYNGNTEAVWASNAYGYDNEFLVVQDDGNVVVYSNTTPV